MSSDRTNKGFFRKRLASVWIFLAAACVVFLFATGAHAQGVLTLSPGRTTATTAGTGVVGYAGDNGPAGSAALASPSAVVYDGAGNLYVADTNNHVIREVLKSSGNIVTVAGTGIAGFSGDGGSATAAQLDTPAGLALDGAGNLYIADSHNQRIRRVSSSGVMTTYAGTGTAGFSGDSGPATGAQLNLPSGVAVDAGGNLYIADTNNQRIRKVTGTTITTLAGTGEQSFTGDGSAATAATLDSPTGVAVSAAGIVYIADRHNQRVRQVDASGTISTMAGSGSASFDGGFGGDGSAAASSMLSKPTGVSVDAAGNVYIADTNNQRIRQVAGTTIATVEGSGDQGFGGDGTAPIQASLNAPKSAVSDASGGLSVADTLDERVRTVVAPALSFGNDAVGVMSAAQTVTLGNTGNAPITISATSFSGPFGLAPGGTCTAPPVVLAPGANCTLPVAFLPVAAGAASGSVSFTGAGVATQSILLAGTGVQQGTTIALSSSLLAPLINQSITFTATVQPTAGTAIPGGNVTFYANGLPLNTAVLTNGTASFTTSFPLAGSYAITAAYLGSSVLSGSTSPVLTQLVGDFNFTIAPDPGSGSHTVVPGDSAVFGLMLAPQNGPFTFPITLSATGLPPGATATFTPATVTLSSSPVAFTMTVQTAKQTGALRRLQRFSSIGQATLALVLLPFVGYRRRLRRSLNLCVLGLLSFMAIAGLTGCGTGSGYFGQPQSTYTISVLGTATGAGGATLQHVATVQLTVQ